MVKPGLRRFRKALMPVRAPQDGNVLVQMVSLLVVSSDGPDSSYIGKLVAAEREAVDLASWTSREGGR